MKNELFRNISRYFKDIIHPDEGGGPHSCLSLETSLLQESLDYYMTFTREKEKIPFPPPQEIHPFLANQKVAYIESISFTPIYFSMECDWLLVETFWEGFLDTVHSFPCRSLFGSC